MDGNSEKLTIKADKSGIVICINKDMTRDEICFELYRKIMDNIGAFKKSGTIYVSFNSMHIGLSLAQDILDFLNSLDEVRVIFRIKEEYLDRLTHTLSEASDTAASSKAAMPVKDFSLLGDTSEKPYIFRGDIKKRQTLETKGNIIIIGDVLKDATVVAGRNIIIIGSLYGNAIAGRVSCNYSYIIALDMLPQKLAIGKASLTCPRIKNKLNLPMIATNEYDLINISYV